MYVYKSVNGGTQTTVGSNYYYQNYPRPIAASNYVAGTKFTITV